MKKIINIKSFSRFDRGYIQLFKQRSRLPTLTGDNKINNKLFTTKKEKPKIIEIDKTPDSTSAKLDLIISNLQKNNSYITQQFFEDMTLQSENNDLRQRMLILYKRRKNKEIQENIKEEKPRLHIDTTKDAINHMKYLSNKYAIDKEILRIKTEQNNKSPPICRYNPKFNYISKHIPVVYFGYHKTNKNINETNNKENDNIKIRDTPNDITNNSSIKISKDLGGEVIIIDKDNLINENNNNNSISNISKNKSTIKTIKIPKNIIKKPFKLNKNLKNPSLLNRIITKLEKEKINDNNISAGRYTINIKTHKNIKRNLPHMNKPINMKYNISVPIFNKMTSREKNRPFHDKFKNMADYNPNYDSILPTKYQYKFTNNKLMKKRIKLRKILGSYNTSGEYVLLPSLNK